MQWISAIMMEKEQLSYCWSLNSKITLASLQVMNGVCATASQISVATTDGIATKGHIL